MATATAAAPTVTPPAAASTAAKDPEPGYATKQTALMTVAGGKTSVKRSGGKVTLTIDKVASGQYADGGQVFKVTGVNSVVAQWNALGEGTRGTVAGQTKRGARYNTWVTWGKMTAVGDGVRVTGTRRSGTVADAVRDKANYQIYSAPARKLDKKNLFGVSLTAGALESKKWQFSAMGSYANITKKGDEYTIVIKKSLDNLAGVQPNGQAAQIKREKLSDLFDTMRKKGVRPRLVVSGMTKVRSDPQRHSLVFYPTKVTGTKKLTFTAKAGSTIGKKTLKRLKTVRGPGFTLDVANPGNSNSFVLVTGDSIASGEGASMGGTYLNGNLALDEKPTRQDLDIEKEFEFSGVSATIKAKESLTIPIPVTNNTQIKRWQFFCQTVDLACTGTEVQGGKLIYKRDPGKIYEKGTWEPEVIAKQGFSCHRSLVAPGTWLARYYREVKGLDVESINLACSGAVVENMLSKPYLGEKPQVEQVAELAAWVPVSEIVNTIGANDIKFSKIAEDCVFAPLNPLLPLFTGTDPNASIVDLLFPTNGNPTPLALLADDVKLDGKGGIKSANTFFSPGFKDAATGAEIKATLCSQQDAVETAKLVAELPGKIKQVVDALHKAAPDARIIQSNYPNEVPNSANTYFPRQQWWEATRDIWLGGGQINIGNTITVGLCVATGKPGDECELDFVSKRSDDASKSQVFSELNGLDKCPGVFDSGDYKGFRAYLLCGGTVASGPQYPPCGTAEAPLACPAADPAWTKYPALADASLGAFFEAASDPANPGYETAQLISKNLYSFTETMAGFANAEFADLTIPDSSPVGRGVIVKFNNDTPDSYRYAQWWLKFLTSGGILDVLGNGAVMYGLDQDWAAQTVIPSLNKGVAEGVKMADPDGAFTVIVDQSQTFNGRELGTKWTDTKTNPLFETWGYIPQGPGADPGKPVPARGPQGVRAQYVNSFLTGQELPVACPDGTVLQGEGSGAKGCIGSSQEALHPNWRGQAAAGNCIVAVVTGAFGGGGNACVRSIGDLELIDPKIDGGERYTPDTIDARTRNGRDALLYSNVPGTDRLCLAPLDSRNDLAAGRYTACTKGFNPEPVWSKDWADGQVTWDGQKVMWK